MEQVSPALLLASATLNTLFPGQQGLQPRARGGSHDLYDGPGRPTGGLFGIRLETGHKE